MVQSNLSGHIYLRIDNDSLLFDDIESLKEFLVNWATNNLTQDKLDEINECYEPSDFLGISRRYYLEELSRIA